MNRIVRIEPDGAIYYYHNDHLGTPLAMTDSAGNIVWKAAYDPFGKAEVDPSSSVTDNFRFPGQYYDKESDLYYNYHRYYDPNTEKYLTPDPLGLDAGINLFVYTNDNPINFTDPFALAAILPDFPELHRPELPDIPFFPLVPPCSGPEGGKAGRQDYVCSDIAKPLNISCHARRCCEEHDKCYKKHGCNMWSWIPLCGSIECKMCNLKVVFCMTLKSPFDILMDSCCKK